MISARDLRDIPSLRDYSDEELDTLAGVAPAQSFAAGSFLCREGAPAHSCFILSSGEIEVLKALPGGERVLATLHRGALVGQMALVDRARRSASVRALSDTVALELSRDVFERLLGAESPLALRFQEQLAIAGIRQLRMATERLTLLVSEQDARRNAPASAREKESSDSLLQVQAAVNEWELSPDDIEIVIEPLRRSSKKQ